MSLLDKRIAQYDIPEIPGLPQGKNVLVFRLPSETRSAGGIIFAETAQQEKWQGVLLIGGLAARDVMRDALIEYGDIVWFGRFAGWEQEIQRDPEGKGRKVLQMKIEDIILSVDALDRLNDHDVVWQEADEYNEAGHVYRRKTDIKRKAAK